MNTACTAQPSRSCDDQDEPGSSAEGDVLSKRTLRPAPEPIDITLSSTLISDERIAALRTKVCAILTHLPRSAARVSISVIHDEAMIELHTTWHNLKTTTDVITFEASTKGPLEVDIAICLDEANRAAADHEHSPDDELLLYIVHGLLHCCGYNDHDDDASARMHTEEDRLLAAIGHDAVYAPRRPRQ
jgi:probable rRNA maturation factor